MFFNKKSQLKSEEYESLLKKIIDLSSKVDDLQSKLKTLWSEYDNLRGKFNRQLSMIKDKQPDEKKEDEAEVLNSPFRIGF